ncbi:hypothetical protein [Chryseobacterium sp. HSC-36S06]|uniref:hypothetical protein n=1 Tax=Chryseobacterium sp. HSC-36S06 TaxID=2910970 RepID=UPI00209C9C0B|nr:hypothetical protein [Chryseobacterium sp. HSC-36S06]MCP2038418.1 hypothetical protein [Chryseobacterium sp. HSC-36S06]
MKTYKDFTVKVNAITPVMGVTPAAIVNTQPYLIFYSGQSNQVNLPVWREVIPEQKAFFAKLAGIAEEGEKMFGYFFNGFYVAHEMGHALQHASGKSDPNLYRNEYTANTIAILYWRKTGQTQELKQCYDYAKKMVKQLPNPFPEGEDPVQYFNEHYEELGADPYKYGFYQFAQFVKIYEDQSLGDFD